MSVFQLTEFNPDASSHTMAEWIDDSTNIKNKLRISDMLMVVKASEALRGRAQDFY